MKKEVQVTTIFEMPKSLRSKIDKIVYQAKKTDKNYSMKRLIVDILTSNLK